MLSFLVTAWRVLKSLMNDRGWADRDVMALWRQIRAKPTKVPSAKNPMQALEEYFSRKESINALMGSYEEALKEWGMKEFFRVQYVERVAEGITHCSVQVVYKVNGFVLWEVEVVSANSFLLLREPKGPPVIAIGNVHSFKVGSRILVGDAIAHFMVSRDR
jgi:hypothetical protein